MALQWWIALALPKLPAHITLLGTWIPCIEWCEIIKCSHYLLFKSIDNFDLSISFFVRLFVRIISIIAWWLNSRSFWLKWKRCNIITLYFAFIRFFLFTLFSIPFRLYSKISALFFGFDLNLFHIILVTRELCVECMYYNGDAQHWILSAIVPNKLNWFSFEMYKYVYAR